jgi:16S rRNA (uracil1498-N3)-methyltransferase
VDLLVRARAAAQVFVEDLEAPELGAAERHHLGRVLRLRAGETVVAADGVGSWRLCTLTGNPGEPALEPAGPAVREERRVPALTVAFAPVKGERPEWVVQKLTEIGVDRIVPIAAARSVVRWDPERAAKTVARLRAISVEAAAQCRAVWLPEVTEPLELAVLLAAAPRGLALCAPGGPPPTLRTPIVAVGPEGGWSDDELAAAPATVGLGPSVLRAETAALGAGLLLSALRAATVRAADEH